MTTHSVAATGVVLDPAPTTIEARRRQSISLADALSSGGLGADAVGMAWSAQSFCFFRTEAGVAVGPGGRIDLSPIFEARLFDSTREIRWRHERNGVGTAVVLAETNLAEPAGWEQLETRTARARITGLRYILWGRAGGGHNSADGWSTLEEQRIGALNVPLPTGPTARIAVEVIEYIGQLDGSDIALTDGVSPAGNAHVVDERLVRLVTVPTRGDR